MRRVGLFKNFSGYCNNKPDYVGEWIPCSIHMEGPDHCSRPYAHIRNIEWGTMTDESLDWSVCEFVGPINQIIDSSGEEMTKTEIYKYKF